MVFQRSMLNWRGVHLLWVYVHCAIYETSFGVMVLQRSMLNWRRGWGQSIMGVCALCYISNFFGLMVFQKSMLDWSRGWVNLAWVYVHCDIYETYVVGVGSICHRYMCIVLYISASLV